MFLCLGGCDYRRKCNCRRKSEFSFYFTFPKKRTYKCFAFVNVSLNTKKVKLFILRIYCKINRLDALVHKWLKVRSFKCFYIVKYWLHRKVMYGRRTLANMLWQHFYGRKHVVIKINYFRFVSCFSIVN